MGGGFRKGTCPLKLKKMAYIHRNGKRIVACSACAIAQNQRTRECRLRQADGCTVSSMELGGEKEKKKKEDFLYSETKLCQKSSFRNAHSNFDFLIITKNLGGLAAMKEAHRCV